MQVGLGSGGDFFVVLCVFTSSSVKKHFISLSGGFSLCVRSDCERVKRVMWSHSGHTNVYHQMDQIHVNSINQLSVNDVWETFTVCIHDSGCWASCEDISVSLFKIQWDFLPMKLDELRLFRRSCWFVRLDHERNQSRLIALWQNRMAVHECVQVEALERFHGLQTFPSHDVLQSRTWSWSCT